MRLTIEAHPNARRERVDFADDVLRVWVRPPAFEGKANAAIVEAIARAFGLRPRQVRILSGATSRHKTVDIDIEERSLAAIRDRLTNRNQ